MNKKKEKIVHITHFDTDAVGCDVALKLAYPDAKIVTHWCGYNGKGSSDNVALDYIERISSGKSAAPYAIYITDISISPEVASSLQSLAEIMDIKIRMYDHHRTSLDNYPIGKRPNWITIDESKCGALLTAEKLDVEQKVPMDLFELIDVYDRWQKTDRRFEDADNLNTLCYIWAEDGDYYKMKRATDVLLGRILQGAPAISEEERNITIPAIIKVKKSRVDLAVSNWKRGINTEKINGLNILYYNLAEGNRCDDVTLNDDRSFMNNMASAVNGLSIFQPGVFVGVSKVRGYQQFPKTLLKPTRAD